MDIQQYISSGIIETYALGMATAEEARELELLAATHPEIQYALQEYQLTLDRYAAEHAVLPPTDLKDKIWQQIVLQEENKFPFLDAGKQSEAFRKTPKNNSFLFSKTSMAAALILLLGSVLINLRLWNQHKSMQSQITLMEKEQEKIVERNNDYTKQLEITSNPHTKKILLEGVGNHSENSALVFWDAQSKAVYLSLDKLPPAPPGKQYQLWAIIDGKPVSAGVYPLSAQGNLQKMEPVSRAEMFAITLEKEGGVPNPTMDQMYVAGKI